MKKYIDGKVCTLNKIEIDNIPVFIKENGVNSGSKQVDYFDDVHNFDEFDNIVHSKKTDNVSNWDDFGKPIHSKKTDNVSNWDDFGEPIHYKKSSKVTTKKDREPVKLEKLSIF